MPLYKDTMDLGVAGGIANTENKNVISRNVETEAGIPFGAPVVQGARDKGIRATKAGDTKFVGIALLDRTSQDLKANGFVKNETARILDRGVVWVKVTEAVKAGDKVAITVATGGFNKTVDSATSVEMPNAVYDTSAPINGLAQLRLK